jgi:hypothetical protein
MFPLNPKTFKNINKPENPTAWIGFEDSVRPMQLQVELFLNVHFYSLMVKDMGFGVRLPEFKFSVCHILGL